MQWINAPASRGRKQDFQFITYVSSIICCIENVGFISIQFSQIDQLHIFHISTEIYAYWMSASSLLVCLKAAITSACIDLPISVYNGRHFSGNGFVTVRPIAMRFVRDKDNYQDWTFQNFTRIRQISLHEINDDVQT